jgi:hypothetical protein
VSNGDVSLWYGDGLLVGNGDISHGWLGSSILGSTATFLMGPGLRWIVLCGNGDISDGRRTGIPTQKAAFFIVLMARAAGECPGKAIGDIFHGEDVGKVLELIRLGATAKSLFPCGIPLWSSRGPVWLRCRLWR